MGRLIKLIIGCGYLGSRVARLWRQAGDDVYVMTRSAGRAADLARDGLRPLLGDVTMSHTLNLPAAETVLYAVGYDRKSGQSIGDVYVDGLKNVLATLAAPTGKFIYISSTGVYGDTRGEWVTEDTPCHPQRAGGKACLAAEEALLRDPLGARSIILRLAGIYGPGRIPNRDALAAGEVPCASYGYLNLIHVDDAAAIVLAAERARVATPRHYLVCDGHPCRRREYYQELARLLGVPSPRFVEPAGGSPAADRTSDKRVSNARLLAELGVRLKYPSFRDGLAASVA